MYVVVRPEVFRAYIPRMCMPLHLCLAKLFSVGDRVDVATKGNDGMWFYGSDLGRSVPSSVVDESGSLCPM